MNWKKIAAKRLQELRIMQCRMDRVRSTMESELVREMVTMFHAHCYPRAIYENRVKEMAKSIAERLL